VYRLRVRAQELEEALSTHHDLETTCAVSTADRAESSQPNDLASTREQLMRVTERAERIEKERDELLLIVAASGQSPSLEASSSPQAAVSPGSVLCDALEIREMKLSAGKHRPRGLVARPRIEGQ